ncbi:MAG TPA: type II toxin-antitoxin system Phd/YefM family antitoxin [Pseudacidobacterium sp.]|nr:type II toxin-antitoxin system Phd/YefM family antitoxin [Pseudacidobacterium sp.]
MEINIHDAKTNLSKLIQKAENGEEVIIARAGKPAVKLVPVPARPRRRIIGSAKGKVWISDDFNSPETNMEIEDLFYNSQLFPDEEK